MTNYRDEHCDLPCNQQVTANNSYRPVVSVTTNFTKPTNDTPALLTLNELETFLHEFGHALHGIFAMTHYAALSGTSVFWDFVELPSQFMENYATEPDFWVHLPFTIRQVSHCHKATLSVYAKAAISLQLTLVCVKFLLDCLTWPTIHRPRQQART